ncbi:hypothetical protein BCR42DRAFT_427159 [Absidia repens]|uniref:Uncharacterized protein n=1 Tax=Absidia repens TaxID=90262 RepID=A0A1X2I0D9_9FUNG|nr:hypothetical protein BCR42DRAFT_427159 [Absidia repens]
MPSSKYKRIIENKDVVDGWKIDNLVSVKLKLYEVMDTKDKLKLFFLSCTTDSLNFSADILPTFATSNIDWPFRFQDNVPPFGMKHGAVNFDLTSVSTIHLIRMNDGYSKLNLKPLQYAVITCGMANYLITEFRRTRKPQCKQLGLNVPNTPISVVYIPICQFTARKKTEEGNVIEIEDHILLVGSFERNKWVLQCPQRRQRISEDDILRHCLDDDPGFDIY